VSEEDLRDGFASATTSMGSLNTKLDSHHSNHRDIEKLQVNEESKE